MFIPILDDFILNHRRLMRFLVPIFCMWINFVSFSYIRGSGVLYMEFRKSYGASISQASWTFTLATSLLGYSTCVAGFLLHYLSCRTVILIGILTTSTSYLLSGLATSMNELIVLAIFQGIGLGFFIFISPLVIMQYLSKAKSFGTGVAICGCNAASLFFPSFIQHLLGVIPMNKVFFVMSGFAFSAVIPGLFLATPNESSKNKDAQILDDEENLKGKKIRIISTSKPEQKDEEKGRASSEEEEEDNSNEQTKLSNFSETKSTNNPIKHLIQDLVIFKNPYYYLILLVEIVFFFCFLSFMIIMQNLPVDHGIEKTKAASLSSFFAIGEFFGSLAPGLLNFYHIMSTKNIYVWSMVIMGAQYIAIPFTCSTFLDFVVSYTLIGMTFGCQLTLPIVILNDYLGFEKAPMAKGFGCVISSTISLLKPLYIDYVKTTTGSYDYILHINGIMCFLCVVPWFGEFIYRQAFQAKPKDRDSCSSDLKIESN